MKKNKSFIQSVKCAIHGAITAFRRERNFLRYVLLIIITLPVNVWLQLSGTQILILFLCVCGAFSAECLNTAIETLCDKTEKEYDKVVKYIKDVAAGSVLWWGIAYFGTEFFMVVNKLIG